MAVNDSSKIIVLEDIHVDALFENSCGSYTNDGSLSHYFSNYTEDFSLEEVGCEEVTQDANSSGSVNSIESKFTELQEEMIIEAVRSRQALWNIRCIEFKNKNYKNRLWEEVTTDANIDVNPLNVLMVRKQWDSLKATYTRAKKRIASGSAGGSVKEYKFSKQLSFLDDTAAPSESTEICGNYSPSPPPLIANESPKNNKRKRHQSYQEENLELKRWYISTLEGQQGDSVDNELESFCGMIKPYLKRLRMPRLQAQQDMLKVVSDALKKQENT